MRKTGKKILAGMLAAVMLLSGLDNSDEGEKCPGSSRRLEFGLER